MLDFYHYDRKNLSPEEWDDFVDESDNGTLFNKRQFLNYHPKPNLTMCHFLLKKTESSYQFSLLH